MTPAWRRVLLTGAATMLAAAAARAGAQAPPMDGVLDEHPVIGYAGPTTDRVAALDAALAAGTRSFVRDPRSGYLLAALDALGVPVDSQLLVFSKTGIQRNHTSPVNPRALYFDESVVVGYIPGAPAIEVAAHDPRQGVVFYTLDQAAGAKPRFTRRTACLTCHVSAATLDVPGIIVRSHVVGEDGSLMPGTGSHTVNHRTLHTERWGGWYVTADTTAPPYIQLGHLGNLTSVPHPSDGPAIVSDRVFIEWLDSAPESRGYPSKSSDAAALLAFDHQMHAINLLTRVNWEARLAAAGGAFAPGAAAVAPLIEELADYFLFVGEAPLAVTVTPRPGFAEQLLARVPRDRQGRSLGELDLVSRLLRYPCSYMIYSEAFDALPGEIREAVFRRMFAILDGTRGGERYAHLSDEDRRAVIEILRDTRPDLPADLR